MKIIRNILVFAVVILVLWWLGDAFGVIGGNSTGSSMQEGKEAGSVVARAIGWLRGFFGQVSSAFDTG